jgi:endonuclease I
VRHTWKHCSILFALLLTPVIVFADAPAGYYDTIDLSSPAALRQSMHNIIDGHTKIPYTSSATDTWNVLEKADEDPYNSGRILDVYQNRTFIKYGAGNNDYNREHTWPKSYGFPDDGSSNLPYSDCHQLFLCDITYNTYRDNLYYDDCISSCTSHAADYYDGDSGANLRDYNSWETWDGRQGDVARAMFYMDVRYAGDYGSEPDLILTDDPGLIQVTGYNASVAYMGLLSTLIEWHIADPVDAREMERNDWVQVYQGNRNPFIDHPDWVSGVFLGVITGVEDDAVPAAHIAAVTPNPFNPSTTISFEMAVSGQARVEIFGVDGSLLRTLASGSYDAGSHNLRWDGRDDTGRSLGSGAFFCRLQAGRTSDVKTLLLLR